MKKMIGKVLSFSEIGGYGFILHDEDKFFFHRNSFRSTISGNLVGRTVEFVLNPGKKGPQAAKIIFMEVDGNKI